MSTSNFIPVDIAHSLPTREVIRKLESVSKQLHGVKALNNVSFRAVEV